MPKKDPNRTSNPRRGFRAARRKLAPAIQQANSHAVAQRLTASGFALRARTVAAYVAADGELDPATLVVRLWSMGKRVALPVVDPLSRRLAFFEHVPHQPLVRGTYDIPVPPPGARHIPLVSIDTALMPLVAFDDHGTRLGMGGGYYDRTLGNLPASMRPRLIGLAHEQQRSAQALPRRPWDVPLDAVATETSVRTWP